ncbi:uncharacterized protein LAESUDRAFT_140293 [Laetiporus sulphureus 93-53]|uniref:Uncharacterized protein n=1 Tax=Laetiporus sulphureus 93-53 TaxID=1314785 RepID=A0A165EED7_9APHY|nr:uncharacterized protein LAESUDRAFT_140293 [Laetiporus sulphureus 93-53]KZT06866.1 hypothetical protein LAESUDRAFT_140293 [Laetiporus sulphureus 93-53]
MPTTFITDSLQRCARRLTRRACHPLHNIPTELLEHIFLLGCQLTCCEECDTTPARLKGKECTCNLPFQFLVSSVCRRWRVVALHRSALWQRLYVSSSMQRELLLEFMSRAGSCSLDVRVCIDERKPTTRHNIMQLLDVVLPEHRRWRELHIVIPHARLLIAIMSRLTHMYAPELEVLQIACPEPYVTRRSHRSMNPLSSFPRIFSGGAPRLRVLEVAECGSPLPLQGNLQFLQDLSVVAGAYPLRTIRELPLYCPALTHLTFTGHKTLWKDLSLPMGLSHFPALQSLRLGGLNDILFLHHLSAPMLEQLQIEELYAPDVSDADAIVVSLASNDPTLPPVKFPRLCCLNIEMHRVVDGAPLITGERLRMLLHLLPAIRYLTFSGPNVIDFVQNLHDLQAGSRQILLPQLEVLSLFGAHDSKFMNAIVAFASVRKPFGFPLRLVQVSAMLTVAKEGLAGKFLRILQLRCQGTRVREVIYPNDGTTWIISDWERFRGYTTRYIHW